MSALWGFKARNHPQQVAKRGARDDVDDRETDPVLFGRLSDRFGGFTLDVAAADHNAKCERYFTSAIDGLSQSWAGHRVWCNPPYSSIEPWVYKAWAEHERCPLIVMLLPNNRAEQKWWQRHVEPHRDRPDSVLRTEFWPGRPRFIKAGTEAIGPNERPPFGVVLLIWEGVE